MDSRSLTLRKRPRGSWFPLLANILLAVEKLLEDNIIHYNYYHMSIYFPIEIGHKQGPSLPFPPRLRFPVPTIIIWFSDWHIYIYYLCPWKSALIREICGWKRSNSMNRNSLESCTYSPCLIESPILWRNRSDRDSRWENRFFVRKWAI